MEQHSPQVAAPELQPQAQPPQAQQQQPQYPQQQPQYPQQQQQPPYQPPQQASGGFAPSGYGGGGGGGSGGGYGMLSATAPQGGVAQGGVMYGTAAADKATQLLAACESCLAVTRIPGFDMSFRRIMESKCPRCGGNLVLPQEVMEMLILYGHFVVEPVAVTVLLGTMALHPSLRPDFVASAMNELLIPMQSDFVYDVAVPKRPEGLGMSLRMHRKCGGVASRARSRPVRLTQRVVPAMPQRGTWRSAASSTLTTTQRARRWPRASSPWVTCSWPSTRRRSHPGRSRRASACSPAPRRPCT